MRLDVRYNPLNMGFQVTSGKFVGKTFFLTEENVNGDWYDVLVNSDGRVVFIVNANMCTEEGLGYLVVQSV